MDSAIEGSIEQAELAVFNQTKILNEVKQKEQGNIDNYFNTIRLKSELSNNQDATKKGGKKRQAKWLINDIRMV